MSFRHPLHILSGAAVLLLAATSCTQDDAGTLPDGTQPLTLTAAIEGSADTRATVDNRWNGDETIAMQVTDGDGTEWYEYKTDGEGKLSGNYYWTKQGPITVQGLYPNITVENNGLIWSVEEDQSRIVVNLTGKAHVPFWNIWVTMENKSMSRSFITLMPSFLSAIV